MPLQKSKADQEKETQDKENAANNAEARLLANTAAKERKWVRTQEDSYPFPGHLVGHPDERKVYPKSKIIAINNDWLKQHPE